jgi:hypothetical protein
MRPALLADQLLDLILRHPQEAAAVAFAAAALSWLMTRTRTAY